MLREDWLKDLRFSLSTLVRNSGMSQRELSMKSGISQTAISRYLNGQQTPSIEAIINLAYALDCELEDIIEIDEKIE